MQFFSIFQLLVLVLQPTSLLFWFRSLLSSSQLRARGSCLQQNSSETSWTQTAADIELETSKVVGEQNRDKMRKNTGLKFIRWPKVRPHINNNLLLLLNLLTSLLMTRFINGFYIFSCNLTVVNVCKVTKK